MGFGKKNTSSNSFHIEDSIAEKKKKIRKASIQTAVLISVIWAYISLTFSAYAAEHPRDKVGEIISGTLEEWKHNPFYLFPINYNIGFTLCGLLIICLVEFMAYQRMRIIGVKNDENIIKGSAEWGKVEELVQKYADNE